MKYGERKPISKAMRQQVYDKYHGHCAYCGREITMKEMQVDHIVPIAYSCYGPREQADKVRKMFEDESINGIDTRITDIVDSVVMFLFKEINLKRQY